MKAIIIILLAIGMFSCGLDTRNNLVENVNKLKRPVRVYKSETRYETHFFTFIDADGKIYVSPETGIEFPDTIK